MLGSGKAMIKRADEETKKKQKRRALALQLEELQGKVQKERTAKEQLSSKSAELRERIDRIERQSQQLLKTEVNFAESVSVGKLRQEARTKPIEGKGLLTFNYGCGDPQTGGNHKGRSSKRTNYTINYCGEKFIGGGSEFAITNERRDRVAKRMQAQQDADAAEAASVLRASSTPLDPRTHTTMLSTAQGPGSVSPHTKNMHQNATSKQHKKMYSSPLQDMGYFGKPSIHFQDIDLMKGFSSKRTRAYTDMTGKRVLMDPCDWPQQKGFVLTGL